MREIAAQAGGRGRCADAAVSEEPWLAARPAEECSAEFCPNASCPYYDRAAAAKEEWFRPHGSFYTRCRGEIQRFRCRNCGKTCSTQTFSIHYWTHSTTDLTAVLQQLENSGGLRQISRTISSVYRVVQNRVRRLARNCLALMDMLIACHTLDEDQAMDGFESYTRSQYHPNNITMVVGSESQLIYAAVHTLLRRKGRMTEGQKWMRLRVGFYGDRGAAVKAGKRLQEILGQEDSWPVRIGPEETAEFADLLIPLHREDKA